MPFVDGMAFLGMHIFHHAIAGSLDDVFHFHCFKDHQGIAFLYCLAGCYQNTDHEPRHRRFNGIDFEAASDCQPELLDEAIVIIGNVDGKNGSVDAQNIVASGSVGRYYFDPVGLVVAQQVNVGFAIRDQVEALRLFGHDLEGVLPAVNNDFERILFHGKVI